MSPTEENEGKLVSQFVAAFSSHTKVVHVTHLINWSGQILPVRKIAREAHKRGIEVIADGAHTLAHLDFKIPDLECDYFASSLHKWLSAPFGSGLLYIRKEKIKNVWALLSNNEPDGPDIRKFESPGTCAIASLSVEGKKPEEVASDLFSKYKIHTVAINWENIHGVRVTPNVYTSTKDLDKLVSAVRKLRAKADSQKKRDDLIISLSLYLIRRL